MTYILGQDKPSPQEVLEHFGVKGMRWGVRKSNKVETRNSYKSKKKNKKLRKVAAIGGTGLAVAGASVAGWAIGRAVGVKLGDAKLQRTIELGQATIDSSLFNLSRSRDISDSTAELASYIVRDTFKNRV